MAHLASALVGQHEALVDQGGLRERGRLIENAARLVTASVDANVQPPAKTESRRRSVRSASSTES